jgi:diadenosine tetraphosphate (Ap4A) HIT family hydrolase
MAHSSSWKPTNWQEMIAGTECPLCDAIKATALADNYGITIADLSFSRLRLSRNQFVAGYCVLICKRHAVEPYQLEPQERAMFFDDLAKVGKALQAVYGADKMNYELLGNLVPHLHAHVVPRYFTDEAPGRPIDPTSQGREVYLSDIDYDERVAQIRQALKSA